MKSQAQSIPEVVIQSLEKIKMPQDSVTWKRRFSLYVAKIISKDSAEKYISMSEEGVVVCEELKVTAENLPNNLLNYVFANFPTLGINEAFIIKHNLNPCIKYKVLVRKAEVYFDRNGNFMDSVSAHEEFNEKM